MGFERGRNGNGRSVARDTNGNFLLPPTVYSKQWEAHPLLPSLLLYLYEHTQAESGLYVGHRLTYEHIHITSFPKMKVNLAAQVYFL